MLLSQTHAVRRKMLEVFNSKLQLSNEIAIDESALASLLEPMVQLATGVGEPNVFNQQLALLCLRSFGKAIGPVSPGPFTEVSSWRLNSEPNLFEFGLFFRLTAMNIFFKAVPFFRLARSCPTRSFCPPWTIRPSRPPPCSASPSSSSRSGRCPFHFCRRSSIGCWS